MAVTLYTVYLSKTIDKKIDEKCGNYVMIRNIDSDWLQLVPSIRTV
jgi:hypothetical protein